MQYKRFPFKDASILLRSETIPKDNDYYIKLRSTHPQIAHIHNFDISLLLADETLTLREIIRLFNHCIMDVNPYLLLKRLADRSKNSDELRELMLIELKNAIRYFGNRRKITDRLAEGEKTVIKLTPAEFQLVKKLISSIKVGSDDQ